MTKPNHQATADVTFVASPEPARGRLRKWVVRVVTVVGLLGFGLALAHRPLLVGFAYLFVVDNPATSDALVLLHGGVDHRPPKLLQAYQGGIAPLILMGEVEDTPVLGVNEVKQIRKYLVANGVSSEAIQELPGGVVGSTYDEAVRVRDYVRSHPVRRITLVTTAFHSARARWIFRKVLRGEGTDVRVTVAHRRSYDEANWYRTEPGLIDYFEESIKTVYYRISYGL